MTQGVNRRVYLLARSATEVVPVKLHITLTTSDYNAARNDLREVY